MPDPRRICRKVRLPLAATLCILALWAVVAALRPKGRAENGSDNSPAGALERRDGQLVLRIRGTPEELGRQHGELLKRRIPQMLDGYVREIVCVGDAQELERLLVCARVMKPSLPAWYQAELSACARAAGVDEDLLLLAQGEGCIRFACRNKPPATEGCSAYVVFDRPEIANGTMRIGRNVDHTYGHFVKTCALATYVTPAPGDGHSFLALGWAGLLGGWTIVNDRGLVAANHLGGGPRANPKGLPALILLRIIAQKAGTVDEALALLRSLPRMRGQIVWLAQPGDKASGRRSRAVAVEFDAEKLYTREARDGILIVTNRNLAFREPGLPEPRPDSVYLKLEKALAAPGPERLIVTTAGSSTIQSIEIDFEEKCLYVAHGSLPAHEGTYVRYPLP